ncbi:hypothetical protein ACWGR4_15570 [Embleya sp. NPDC055664]|uniref:hypothetical protein n=1 Tax=unclassified Embleya TaxID=2699296 RepID=UPI003678DF5D
MHMSLSAVAAAAPEHIANFQAVTTETSSVGRGVTVGVPILIIFILFYMVTHKGYKLLGLILAFVAGVMLSGTQVASSLSELVDHFVTAGVNAVSDTFS